MTNCGMLISLAIVWILMSGVVYLVIKEGTKDE